MASKDDVISVLRKCYDPEIPINIYDLGLVYNIELKGDEGKVDVRMTLTAPGCPASAYIHQDVKRKLEQLPGIKEAKVDIVWDPPWTPEMMSETAKKQFGWASEPPPIPPASVPNLDILSPVSSGAQGFGGGRVP